MNHLKFLFNRLQDEEKSKILKEVGNVNGNEEKLKVLTQLILDSSEKKIQKLEKRKEKFVDIRVNYMCKEIEKLEI